MSFLVSSGCVGVRSPLTFTHTRITSLQINDANAAISLRHQSSQQTVPGPGNGFRPTLLGSKSPCFHRKRVKFCVASCYDSVPRKVQWDGKHRESHTWRALVEETGRQPNGTVWDTLPPSNLGHHNVSSFDLDLSCRLQRKLLQGRLSVCDKWVFCSAVMAHLELLVLKM